MKLTDIWIDETGSLSTSRILLWLVVLFTGYVILRHLGGIPVDNAVWAILTTCILAFSGWAGGARVMEYLGPHLSGIASSISKADKRQPNLWRDDERDDA